MQVFTMGCADVYCLAPGTPFLPPCSRPHTRTVAVAPHQMPPGVPSPHAAEKTEGPHPDTRPPAPLPAPKAQGDPRARARHILC